MLCAFRLEINHMRWKKQCGSTNRGMAVRKAEITVNTKETWNKVMRKDTPTSLWHTEHDIRHERAFWNRRARFRTREQDTNDPERVRNNCAIAQPRSLRSFHQEKDNALIKDKKYIFDMQQDQDGNEELWGTTTVTIASPDLPKGEMMWSSDGRELSEPKAAASFATSF